MWKIEPVSSSNFGPCSCCGKSSRTVVGNVLNERAAEAMFKITWTSGGLVEHGATFEFLFSCDSLGIPQNKALLVTVFYRKDGEASGFMVVDSIASTEANDLRPLKSLLREEVIGTELAQKVFDLLDFIWLNDTRIGEITGLEAG